MQNRITLEFADGEYDFFLGLEQIHELERKCDTGICEIFARVMAGTHATDHEFMLSPMHGRFTASDIVETIRLGLMGGKRGEAGGKEVQVTNSVANRLIAAYVLNQPLSKNWEIAAAVLGACVVGYEPQGKAEAAASETQPTSASDSTTD